MKMNKDNKNHHSISLGMNDPSRLEELPKEPVDTINPNYYTGMTISPYEYVTKNNLNWEQSNVVKYVSRYKGKNGKEDLLKCIKYIELLIEREYPLTP